eukprot:c21945_g1_i1 orf=787-3378(-)
MANEMLDNVFTGFETYRLPCQCLWLAYHTEHVWRACQSVWKQWMKREKSYQTPIEGLNTSFHPSSYWKLFILRGARCTGKAISCSAGLPTKWDCFVLSKSGLIFLLVLSSFFWNTTCFGIMSSIAVSSGPNGLVCAIEASGKQQAFCWGSDTNQSSADGPALYGISGGEGFVCGVKVDSLQPYCWKENLNLPVPAVYQQKSYSSIAAGANHVCAVTSSMDASTGSIDCWSMGGNASDAVIVPPSGLPLFEQIIAGENYSCGLSTADGQVFCWGESTQNLTDPPTDKFASIASGARHVCGILKGSGEARCWGNNEMGQAQPPIGISFVSLSCGYAYSCGIREDSHEIECWGSFNHSDVPRGTEFLAIASANLTCGIREDNLLVDCWQTGTKASVPPLQLFSPGLCSSSPCGSTEFRFNASTHGFPNLLSLCLNASQEICAPCAHICPGGTFLSSTCTLNEDRECTDCSLCQNQSCLAICPNSSASSHDLIAHSEGKTVSLPAIVGAAISGGFIVALLAAVVFCLRRQQKGKYSICSGRSDTEIFSNGTILTPPALSSSTSAMVSKHSQEMFRMQAFRLVELKEATNNFKEFNELGRGSYGFVYRALLPDGRQVAVKRANAARRIHSNSRDFETELEILCKVRHVHLVNLLGYCEEMGERLLVYEFMAHGTLHDHLHGGLSPLSWGLRLKIAVHAARGIEYLHKYASPRILHRDIKSSNILLDGEWVARVADFGLSSTDKSILSPLKHVETGYLDPDFFRSQSFTEKSDVYSFGVVLLELLSGRRPKDVDYDPPNIVDWAAPLIENGKSACVLDSNIDLPKNVEPLLKMADVALQCVKVDPDARPTMSAVAANLEQFARSCNISL